MPTVQVKSLEPLRTPLDGHDDYLWSVTMREGEDEATLQVKLTGSGAIPAGFPPERGEEWVRERPQQRVSGLANDRSVLEQVRTWESPVMLHR